MYRVFLVSIVGVILLTSCGVNKSGEAVKKHEDINTKSTQAPISKEIENVAKHIQEMKIAENRTVEQTKNFSEEELNIFKTIKGYYKEFQFSESYSSIGDNTIKKMIFNKEGPLYFNLYISYNMKYFSDSKTINYNFDAGRAYRGEGSYFYIDKDSVIKVEKSYGISAYGYEIYNNGKKIDEELKNIENEIPQIRMNASQMYKNDDLGFSLECPKNWLLEEKSDGVKITGKNEEIIIDASTIPDAVTLGSGYDGIEGKVYSKHKTKSGKVAKRVEFIYEGKKEIYLYFYEKYAVTFISNIDIYEENKINIENTLGSFDYIVLEKIVGNIGEGKNNSFSPNGLYLATVQEEFSNARGEEVSRLYINEGKNSFLAVSELGTYKWINEQYFIYSNSHRYRVQGESLLYLYDISNKKSISANIKIPEMQDIIDSLEIEENIITLKMFQSNKVYKFKYEVEKDRIIVDEYIS